MSRIVRNARDTESLRVFELQYLSNYNYLRVSEANPSCVLRNSAVIRGLVRSSPSLHFLQHTEDVSQMPSDTFVIPTNFPYLARCVHKPPRKAHDGEQLMLNSGSCCERPWRQKVWKFLKSLRRRWLERVSWSEERIAIVEKHQQSRFAAVFLGGCC